MRSAKYIGLFAACGFVLSFVSGLFSHSSILSILLKALIFALIFGVVGLGISFVYSKFLSDGNIPMDNNYAEQAIRPFTLGRKNFVIIESDNGAKASAVLYSLAETAKANELNTYKYFELLLSELPNHMNDTDLRFIDDLMPWSPRIQRECPSHLKKS